MGLAPVLGPGLGRDRYPQGECRRAWARAMDQMDWEKARAAVAEAEGAVEAPGSAVRVAETEAEGAETTDQTDC